MMKKILAILLIMHNNNLYVFLNNKIISCDTILPIMLEVKNKNKNTISLKILNKILKDCINFDNIINTCLISKQCDIIQVSKKQVKIFG